MFIEYTIPHIINKQGEFMKNSLKNTNVWNRDNVIKVLLNLPDKRKTMLDIIEAKNSYPTLYPYFYEYMRNAGYDISSLDYLVRSEEGRIEVLTNFLKDAHPEMLACSFRRAITANFMKSLSQFITREYAEIDELACRDREEISYFVFKHFKDDIIDVWEAASEEYKNTLQPACNEWRFHPREI